MSDTNIESCQIIESFLKSNEDKMIELTNITEFVNSNNSKELFCSCVVNILLSINSSKITLVHLMTYIFHISCEKYCKIAIFMLKNNLLTNDILTSYINNSTPLHKAINKNNIILLNHFEINVPNYVELLTIQKFKIPAPIFSMRPSNLLLFLKSEKCTEDILKICNCKNKYNIFDHIYYNSDFTECLKYLLKSDKCTHDVITQYSNEMGTHMLIYGEHTPEHFKILMQSEKINDNYIDMPPSKSKYSKNCECFKCFKCFICCNLEDDKQFYYHALKETWTARYFYDSKYCTRKRMKKYYLAHFNCVDKYSRDCVECHESSDLFEYYEIFDIKNTISKINDHSNCSNCSNCEITNCDHNNNFEIEKLNHMINTLKNELNNSYIENALLKHKLNIN